MPGLPVQLSESLLVAAATTSCTQILVVDDDQALRDSLVLLLRHAGYSVESAADGRLALRYLARHSVSVVITDMVMPNFDGLELIFALRKAVPRPRLIAMSGKNYTGLADTLYMAGQLGAEVQLDKPFEPEQLLQCVRQVLNLGAVSAATPPAER